MDHARLIEDIAARQAIGELKARYFRHVDAKDWAALRGLFTADATMHMPEAKPDPLPVDEAIAFIAGVLAGCTSIHHGHMPEIEITSPDNATGVWAMEDRLSWPADAPGTLGLASLHGFGHYREDYVRRDGQWLFARTRLDRLRVDVVPAQG